MSTAGEGQGNSSNVTTQLFPNLTFGCNGTIVRLTVAVGVKNETREQGPKIQIWRENETGSDRLYYKPGPDIVISNSSCENFILSEGIFRCTLNESARVSVQPGDILGLEIPPTNDDDYEVLFTTSDGSETYVFQRQLSSTVNLSEADDVTNSLVPQITFLVTVGKHISSILLSYVMQTIVKCIMITSTYTHSCIDEAADSCSGNAINSVIPPVCSTQTTQTNGAIDTTSSVSDTLMGVTALVIIVALLTVIIALSVIMFIHWKKWKKQKQIMVDNNDTTYSNLAYNSKSVYS